MKPRQVRVRQGTPEWDAFRRRHVTASDAPVIVGESPYRSALDLYLEKTTGEQVQPDPATAHRFALGHAMEPVALAMYSERTGRKVRRGRVLESREHPWLSASLDGEADGRLVEAKWSTSRRFDDGVPGDVLVQVMHQMAVAGAEAADVAVLTPRDFTIHEVRFDLAFWLSIFELERAFLAACRDGIPPAPDASEASRQAVLRLHPQDDGTTMIADAEMGSLVRLILDAKGRQETIAEELQGWENALRFLMADASTLIGPGFSVTYKRAKDSQRIGWAEYVASLERIVAPEHAGELADIKGVYTYTSPGTRRLLVKREMQG
jgi:putative phage-type endonuclease